MTDIDDLLRRISDNDGVLREPADLDAYRGDMACPLGGEVLAVARPRTTAQVREWVAACAAAGIAITPRGGGTGLSGGATPSPGRRTLVMSFERLHRIRALDRVGNTMIVEAGCPLQVARQAAAQAGRLLGLDHGGSGSSQIGGNLSTNAGGNNVLRYGMAREQVLGLEVVLADGSVLSDLRELRKNNAGYDLKQIFLGAEGTLGLITAAVLRLRPAPVACATACLGLDSLDGVLQLFTRAQETMGDALVAFEVMSREALALHWVRVAQPRRPLEADTRWLVLVEADSPSRYFDLARAFDELMAFGLAREIVRDGTIAASEAQRQALWRLREGIALAMIETPGSLKSDQAVPVAAIAQFVAQACAAVEAVVPGCVPAPFGHVGDGNIHFNVLPPPGMTASDFRDHWPALTQSIEDCALALGGTVSAEHGIGLLKRQALQRMRPQGELQLMARLKRTLDPRGLMNPGKILL
ncbi:MAG: FAD-binding oxidoreductase [Proteobacteria bacterium]|nr:FAD-binding oxidoreductase [Pseudomonadota bacterium]